MGATTQEFRSVPVINVAPLVLDAARAAANEGAAAAQGDAMPEDVAAVVAQIGQACRDVGFFYVTHTGVEELAARLDALARQFFALPEEEKMRIPMSRGGRAWRGFFPVGGELTSGKPDMKEGLYLGTELPPQHPLVAAGTPLHGPNLFPERPAELRQVVLEYMEACTRLGHTLMRGIAMSLGLPAGHFRQTCMTEPLCLFRIFGYPAARTTGADGQELWGVGEHTDYGVLTLLHQDSNGGLQVKNRDNEWIDAPPVPGSLVINIGDMLEVMTGGLYRSTPHRVRNSSSNYRVSLPFFFDPDWAAPCHPLPIPDAVAEGRTRVAAGDGGYVRWDGAVLSQWRGTYGQYVLSKVSKVFPDLAQQQDVQQDAAAA